MGILQAAEQEPTAEQGRAEAGEERAEEGMASLTSMALSHGSHKLQAMERAGAASEGPRRGYHLENRGAFSSCPSPSPQQHTSYEKGQQYVQ